MRIDRPLTDAERRLVEDHYARACEEAGHAEARLRRGGQRGDFAYLIDAATTGLMRAAQDYDPARCPVFWVYAKRRIWTALGNVVRDEQRARERMPVQALHGDTSDRHDWEAERVAADQAARLLAFVPGRYRAAVGGLLMGDLSQRDAARLLGCCQTWAARVVAHESARMRRVGQAIGER